MPSSARGGEAPRRTGWMLANCGWLLGGFAGVTAAPESLPHWAVPLCWAVYLVVLAALLSRLAQRMGLIIVIPLVAYLAALYFLCVVELRADILLRSRGQLVHAVVTGDRVTSPRGYLIRHYTLSRPDGSPVRGGEIDDGTVLERGRHLTVYEDPEGEIQPSTPGHTHPTVRAVVAGGLLALATGALVWAAYSRSLESLADDSENQRSEPRPARESAPSREREPEPD
ncbi:hypothetical protein MMF93_31580 [Streptomyces tubbatahanensis]|uniref:Integral membrane protein n=1 Tax=Streptomyces tubbatahanensis TaxID=2923272 RepID=A0ABY3Y190_9ACTN|nr:hypothetical protein [Streptomyces tubbatahanensis]UNT00508.1 hypothetical protein MMF93_31580 [Streptomyces tubbatahanensis]